MAMCVAAKQSQWIALTLRDMGSAHLIGQSTFQLTLKQKMKYMIASPVLIKGDNQAALGLVRDAQILDRLKHIDVAYHY
jgi:dihydroxyacetone kinase DhaKLM complex PTS-EIIA-like component DhaM